MLNKLINCSCSDTWKDIALLIVRVALGAVFFYHGYMKFGMGTEQVAGFLGQIGIPLTGIMAPILIWTEMIGGIALILGAFTHWISKLLIIIAVVAFATVHMKNGFNIATGGYEFIMLIFATSVVTMTFGAGKYSVDNFLKNRNQSSPTTTQ